MTTSAETALDSSRGFRRADVGVTALGLAVLLVLLLAFGSLLANMPAVTGQAPGLVSTLWLVQSSGMILSFLLGLAAVLTGRGRAWGAAAMVLSVLGNAYVWILLYSSIGAAR